MGSFKHIAFSWKFYVKIVQSKVKHRDVQSLIKKIWASFCFPIHKLILSVSLPEIGGLHQWATFCVA